MLRLVTMEKEYSIQQEGWMHLDVSDCQMDEDVLRVKVQKEQTECRRLRKGVKVSSWGWGLQRRRQAWGICPGELQNGQTRGCPKAVELSTLCSVTTQTSLPVMFHCSGCWGVKRLAVPSYQSHSQHCENISAIVFSTVAKQNFLTKICGPD